MRNTLVDGDAEQNGFLADERHLPPQPFQVKRTDVSPIEKDLARHWEIEAFQKPKDGRLSRPRSTNKRNHFARLDGEIEILNNYSIWSRGVDVLNIFKLNISNKLRRFLSLFCLRVNRRVALNSVEDLCRSGNSPAKSLDVWQVVAEGDTRNHGSHNDGENVGNTEFALFQEAIALPEREGILHIHHGHQTRDHRGEPELGQEVPLGSAR